MQENYLKHNVKIILFIVMKRKTILLISNKQTNVYVYIYFNLPEVRFRCLKNFNTLIVF